MKIRMNYTADFKLKPVLYFAASNPATVSYINCYDAFECKLDNIITYSITNMTFEELHMPLNYRANI